MAEAWRDFYAIVLGGAEGVWVWAYYLVLGAGWLHWLQAAWLLDSGWMLAAGLLPPLMFIAAPVGLWGLVFGLPLWVYAAFG